MRSCSLRARGPLIAVLVAFLALVGVGPASAVAPHLDPTYDQAFERIIKGQFTDAEYARIVQLEGQLVGGGATKAPSKVLGSLAKVRSQIGMFGSGKFFARIGTLGLVTTSFQAGWSIGGWVNGWLGIGGDGSDFTAVTQSGYTVCSSYGTISIRWFDTPLYGADFGPGFYIACTSADGASGLRVQYTANPTGSYNAAWTPYFNAIKAETGGTVACLPSSGFGLNDICVLRADPGMIGASVRTALQRPASSAPSGSTSKTPAAEPSRADTLTAARAEAAANPAFGGWIDFVLDPDNNPDPTTIEIPRPTGTETASEYEDRLRQLGWLGTIVVTEAAQPDARFRTGVVLSVTPSPGTRVDPEAQVSIRTNPDTEPNPDAVVPDDGACTTWLTPSINFEALAVPLDRFPFGIFAWAGDGLSTLAQPGEAPVFVWTMPGTDWELRIDLGIMAPLVAILRPIIAFSLVFGMFWYFGRAFLGAKGGGES